MEPNSEGFEVLQDLIKESGACKGTEAKKEYMSFNCPNSGIITTFIDK